MTVEIKDCIHGKDNSCVFEPKTLGCGDGCENFSARTKPEVWTRVMGYHRPVEFFNTGKQGEWNDRRLFQERTI